MFPPNPLLLVSRVDPGQSVHESEEHGFRLLVQKGSLRCAIGPITIQEFPRVVKCEDGNQEYLVRAVVDCQPSGVQFRSASLLMDFRIEDTPRAKILQSFQVSLTQKHDTRSEPRHSLPETPPSHSHCALLQQRALCEFSCFVRNW